MLKLNNGSPAEDFAHVQALSHARLSNYRSFFGATNDGEALGLYRWNDELSAVLFRTISLVEVVLRNQFHLVMSQRYGAVGTQGSKDWYAHLALSSLSKAKIMAITHYKKGHQLLSRVPAPSPDDVVSGLTFGFWPRLLDTAVDIHQQSLAWGPILVDVLPGHRQRQASYWGKLKHRDALFARLDLCNELRNRIAHHEPIWKLGPLMHESRSRPGSPVRTQAPAPATPADALNRLRTLYERIIELLSWLSPAVAAKHKSSEVHLRSMNLLQIDTLHRFRHALPPTEINLAALPNLKALRKALRYAARRKQSVIIKDGHRLIGGLSCITP